MNDGLHTKILKTVTYFPFKITTIMDLFGFYAEREKLSNTVLLSFLHFNF